MNQSWLHRVCSLCLNLDSWTGLDSSAPLRRCPSSLLLSFTCWNICSPRSLAPFTPPWQLHCGIFSSTEVVGEGDRWGRDGILHHACSGPSKQTWAQSCQCVRANNSTESDSVCAQVLSGQSQIHPELSKATDERLELWVLPPPSPPLPTGPNANTSITPPHFQAEQMKKWGRQRRKHNQHREKKKNLDQLGHWMSPGSTGECTVAQHEMEFIQIHSRAKVSNLGLRTTSGLQCKYIWPMRQYKVVTAAHTTYNKSHNALLVLWCVNHVSIF